VGYLSTRYSKIKEPTIKVISTILRKETSGSQMANFLAMYSAVYEHALPTPAQTCHTPFIDTVQQSHYHKAPASLSLILEDQGSVLTNGDGLAAVHTQSIFSHFMRFVSKKSNFLTKALASQFQASPELTTFLTIADVDGQEAGMVIETPEGGKVDAFLGHLAQTLGKTGDSSHKTGLEFRYFFSFVDAFSQLRDFGGDVTRQAFSVIFEEAIKQSTLSLYTKGVRALMRLQPNMPTKMNEFLTKLNDKFDLKNGVASVEVASLTTTEYDSWTRILKAIFTHFYFSTKGQKNRREGLAKQRFILNYVSGLGADQIRILMETFARHLNSGIFGETCQAVKDFTGLTLGGVTRLFAFLDNCITTFGLQITDKIGGVANYLAEIFEFLTDCAKAVTDRQVSDDGAQGPLLARLAKILKAMKRKVVELLTKVYTRFLEVDLDGVTRRLLGASRERISREGSDGANSQDSITKLLLVFAEFEVYKAYFVEYPFTIVALFKSLGAEGASKLFAQKIGDFVRNLIRYYPGVDGAMEKSTSARLHSKLKTLRHSLPSPSQWWTQGLEKGVPESVVGLYLLHAHSEALLEGLTLYFEHTASLPKQAMGINQPFMRELLIICLQRCTLTNQTLVDRIANILIDFLSPKTLSSLSPQSYSVRNTAEGEFLERVQSKVNQVLQVIDILALVLRSKRDIEPFVLGKLVPIIRGVSNGQVFYGLKALLESVLANPDAAALKPSVSLMAPALGQGKRLDQDLDYDQLFNYLERAEVDLKSFDAKNLQIFLAFVFKLVGSQDLSIRIKTQDIFKTVCSLPTPLSAIWTPELLPILKDTFNALPFALRQTYSSEDCLKNYADVYTIYAEFVSRVFIEEESLINTFGQTFAMISDVVQLSRVNFFGALFNPKLSAKSTALSELLFSELTPAPITSSSLLLPLIENVLFLNLARHMSDLNDNNFRVQASKKAHLTNLVTAAGKLIQKLTKSFGVQKLSGYISKKLSLLETHAEFQHPILVLLSSVFDNFSANNTTPDAIAELNRSFADNSAKFESIFTEMKAFQGSAELRSYRTNYRQMATGKLKKVRSQIHGAIDFTQSTVDFLKPQAATSAVSASDAQLVSQREKVKRLVLTRLKKLLFEGKKTGENLDLQFSLSECFLKVLRLFPVSLFKVEFAKMIMELAQLLRNKDSAVREKTMRSLFRIAVMAGPYCLPICISEVSFALAVSSYRHVRNYTVWYILNQIYNVNRRITLEAAEEPGQDAGESGEPAMDIEQSSSADAEAVPAQAPADTPTLADQANRTDLAFEQSLAQFTPGSVDALFSQLAELITEETFTDMFDEKVSDDRKKKSKEIKKHKAKDLIRLFTSQSTHPEAVP
jgi:hypothetical protein